MDVSAPTLLMANTLYSAVIRQPRSTTKYLTWPVACIPKDLVFTSWVSLPVPCFVCTSLMTLFSLVICDTSSAWCNHVSLPLLASTHCHLCAPHNQDLNATIPFHMSFIFSVTNTSMLPKKSLIHQLTRSKWHDILMSNYQLGLCAIKLVVLFPTFFLVSKQWNTFHVFF